METVDDKLDSDCIVNKDVCCELATLVDPVQQDVGSLAVKVETVDVKLDSDCIVIKVVCCELATVVDPVGLDVGSLCRCKNGNC